MKERTYNAIKHVEQFIPTFTQATVGSKPLFGAQQIPGYDPTLRVAEVSFPLPEYALRGVSAVHNSKTFETCVTCDPHKALTNIITSFKMSTPDI